jgi:hypothetical protein
VPASSTAVATSTGTVGASHSSIAIAAVDSASEIARVVK